MPPFSRWQGATSRNNWIGAQNSQTNVIGGQAANARDVTTITPEPELINGKKLKLKKRQAEKRADEGDQTKRKGQVSLPLSANRSLRMD